MIGAAQRYRELLEDLLLERELRDGNLPPTEEARFAGELDRCWNAMTEQEQEDAERRFVEHIIPVSTLELSEEDIHVTQGARIPPRKAA